MKKDKILAIAFPTVLLASMLAQTVYAAGSCSGEASSNCSGNCAINPGGTSPDVAGNCEWATNTSSCYCSAT
jgi:hypothetical protein